MPRCIVSGCTNYSSKASRSKGLKMHAFPLNLTRIKLWLKLIGQDFGNHEAFAQRIMDAKNSNPYRVCSDHFTPQCYITQGSKTVLTTDAVPTIFPNRKTPLPRMEDVNPSPPPKKPREEVLSTDTPTSMGADGMNKLCYVVGAPVPLIIVNEVFARSAVYNGAKDADTQFDRDYGVKHKRTSTNPRYYMKNVGTSTDPQEGLYWCPPKIMVDASTSTDPMD
ncbi:hypothetical protein XENTR_v10004702 [Xenopus tropicalis]|uniref:THAP domain-containing protein 1 n=1 Tax=Xenopus tropicalis TaxID=8364 RepID=A0A1B8Y0Z2_XENTR|nr:THAP domain-containing protein 1 [Xenopus tropicalis]XP_031752304.1 THAP domain-containing protein 1 [Xenopus tropicalis]KAE8621167.1 hypothetical protein XENTR_v10004702 [Xenopus tropicalis]|eukprot:XP_002943178.1 PREDICTED: THAP domain-containing protein 1-like [Xenopus tropicalis]